MTDDTLRAALEAVLRRDDLCDDTDGEHHTDEYVAAFLNALDTELAGRAALAAPAPDEGPDDERTPMFAHEVIENRPAVPAALDVERLAKVFRGAVMADWLGLIVGITDPKHPPLAEGFAHDFAASIAREYAALSEQDR